VYVNYKRTGLSPSSFQQIGAGQTVTVPVNAAKSYKLSGVPQAKVRAIQGFRYAVGSDVPSSLKELAVCEDVTSGEMVVTPDQASVAEYVFPGRVYTISVLH
jgi:deuterolysin